jgi:hypothetical protein
MLKVTSTMPQGMCRRIFHESLCPITLNFVANDEKTRSLYWSGDDETFVITIDVEEASGAILEISFPTLRDAKFVDSPAPRLDCKVVEGRPICDVSDWARVEPPALREWQQRYVKEPVRIACEIGSDFAVINLESKSGKIATAYAVGCDTFICTNDRNEIIHIYFTKLTSAEFSALETSYRDI